MLSKLILNGEAVVDGQIVDLAPYTTEVEVEATAVDENATVEVSGGTELVVGENTLTVTVTAQNGDVVEYVVTLMVALGDSVELESFTVADSDVADGDVVNLEFGTSSVDVVVATLDAGASVEVSGGTDG